MPSARMNIKNHVITTLETIPALVAPGAGGVQKPGLADWSLVPLAIVSFEDEEKDDDVTGLYGCDLNMEIGLIDTRLADGTDTRDDDEIIDALISEVERVLAADTTRGGLAVKTSLLGATYLGQDGNDSIGAIYRVRVRYRHQELDPGTVG